MHDALASPTTTHYAKKTRHNCPKHVFEEPLNKQLAKDKLYKNKIRHLNRLQQLPVNPKGHFGDMTYKYVLQLCYKFVFYNTKREQPLTVALFHLPHFTVAFGIMKLNLLFLLLLQCKYTAITANEPNFYGKIIVINCKQHRKYSWKARRFSCIGKSVKPYGSCNLHRKTASTTQLAHRYAHRRQKDAECR